MRLLLEGTVELEVEVEELVEELGLKEEGLVVEVLQGG